MPHFDTPDILALIGALCAVIMVLFSFVLLYRGTIKLHQATPAEAIKIEFQKVINFQTRYPALGLFAFGVGFFIVACWYEQISREGTAKSTEVQIPIDSDDPGDAKAHFFSDFGEVQIDNDRKIVKKLPGDLEEVEVTIKETGYESWDRAIHPSKAEQGKLVVQATLKKIFLKARNEDGQIPASPLSKDLQK